MIYGLATFFQTIINILTQLEKISLHSLQTSKTSTHEDNEQECLMVHQYNADAISLPLPPSSPLVISTIVISDPDIITANKGKQKE